MLYVDDHLDDVREMSLIEAYDAAQQAWHVHSVFEDLDAARVRSQADGLVDIALRRDCTTGGDLVTRGAELLRTATGITHLTRYLSHDDAESVQQHRSALGAILAGAAIATETDPLPLLADLPEASARHGGAERALHDDEILLLRLRALHLPNRGPRLVPALLHTIMGEAGARPSETTVITLQDFDSPIMPTEVDLPGVHQMAAGRTVPVPKWARPLVADVLAQHTALYGSATPAPLAFRGKQPGGHAASASASRILAHAFAEVGIVEPPQPMALARWRIAKTADNQGLDAAADLSGHVKIDTALSFMGRTMTPPKQRQRARRRGYATVSG